MSNEFDVITYIEEMAFDYTLPGEGTKGQITKEAVMVWEESFEAFLKETDRKKPYKLNEFKSARSRDFFIRNVEKELEDLIDEVSEDISQKTKFGFEYTSPTYED